MNPFELDLLILPALFIFCVIFTVVIYTLKNYYAAFIAAFLKTSIYLIYFGWIFDGSFTFLDDWSYLDGGQILCNANIGIFNIFEEWDLVASVGRGNHVSYYLYNCYAFGFFGYGYYAPVAINIILTVFVALFGMKIVRKEFKLPYSTSGLFFLFLLFHPDITAWSVIINGKDVLVLTLHVVTLYGISCFFDKHYRTAFLAISMSIAILLFTRFYVPLVFLVAFILLIVTEKKRYLKKNIQLSIIGGVLTFSAFLYFTPDLFTDIFARIKESYSEPIYGIVRFLLTPIPFNTEPAYSFLNIPASLHWLLLPFMLIGINVVFKNKTPFARYFIFYFILFTLLYAFYAELQGPRHRVQMDFAIALFQFLGLLQVFGRRSNSATAYSSS